MCFSMLNKVNEHTETPVVSYASGDDVIMAHHIIEPAQIAIGQGRQGHPRTSQPTWP